MTFIPAPRIDLGTSTTPQAGTQIESSTTVRAARGRAGRDGSRAVCEVASESKPDVWYTVYEQRDGALFCSCPDFIYRRRPRGELCKHLIGLERQELLKPVAPAAPKRAATDLSLPRFLILDLAEDVHETPGDHHHDHLGRGRHGRGRRRRRPVV